MQMEGWCDAGGCTFHCVLWPLVCRYRAVNGRGLITVKIIDHSIGVLCRELGGCQGRHGGMKAASI